MAPSHRSGNSTEGTQSVPIDVDAVHDPPEARASSSKLPTPVKKGRKTLSSFMPCKETDNFWHTALANEPPPSFVPGLVLLLKQGLTKSHERGVTRKAVLCDARVVHTYRQPWDATWGCGYRNFMMCCSSLMTQDLQPLYFPLLDSPLPPSIRNLQRWIEDAWMHGFDPEGQAALKNLVGSKRWIGTADIWVAFTYMGIPARLVDFDFEGKAAQGLEALQRWIVDYFTPPQSQMPAHSSAFQALRTPPVTLTDKMPIILQHKGHSRTIVGYEVDKKGDVNLLTFDPAYRPHDSIQNAAVSLFYESTGRGASVSIAPGSPVGSKRKRDDDEENRPAEDRSKGVTKKNQKLKFPVSQGDASSQYLSNSRLTIKQLNKKNAYQILYFPMTAPLTDTEKAQLRNKPPPSIRIPV